MKRAQQEKLILSRKDIAKLLKETGLDGDDLLNVKVVRAEVNSSGDVEIDYTSGAGKFHIGTF